MFEQGIMLKQVSKLCLIECMFLILQGSLPNGAVV